MTTRTTAEGGLPADAAELLAARRALDPPLERLAATPVDHAAVEGLRAWLGESYPHAAAALDRLEASGATAPPSPGRASGAVGRGPDAASGRRESPMTACTSGARRRRLQSEDMDRAVRRPLDVPGIPRIDARRRGEQGRALVTVEQSGAHRGRTPRVFDDRARLGEQVVHPARSRGTSTFSSTVRGARRLSD